MVKLNGWKLAWAGFLFWAMMGVSNAQNFTTLLDFDYYVSGAQPQMALVQGADGELYGTTPFGGDPNGYANGTVFKVTLAGKLTTLYNFCYQYDCTTGVYPFGGLVLGTDGRFYGNTARGGTEGAGTVFRITRQGSLSKLYDFGYGDFGPSAGLIQATDGDFYGTTGWAYGGSGNGIVFKITPQGTFTTLHVFCSEPPFCPDGSRSLGALVEGNDRSFYGTTYDGACCGTIFKVSRAGHLTTLHTFNGVDGAYPSAGLLRDFDGSFYGTTSGGGAKGWGTVFKMNSRGTLTKLYEFCTLPNCADGSLPSAPLLRATDGNFYGTTTYGGDIACEFGCGTIFKITSQGDLTTLYRFGPGDGFWPRGGLLQATNGIFYGTTTRGASFDDGSIFSLDMGFAPFVTFVHDSGKVGGAGGILGQGFTGTTDVSINGTPAKFTVVSDTFLKATVPDGTTTGFVTVTTPGGTLASNKVFRVLPQLLSFDPPSGPVGTQVTITGVSFSQTKAVGFGDRVPAQFTVNSDTQVTATVPSGAKTGPIGIKTKGGIAISSGTFTVTP